MQPGAFIDLYEVLQISPNADAETVRRVYRILAARHHPDNRDTGDAAVFQEISQAYAVLNDPEQRAAYDAQHREMRRLTWRTFDQSNSTQGVDAEICKRHGIVSLLYRKRVAQPQQAGMSPAEFEDLLGAPREHLEFSLWYLTEAGHIRAGENGLHEITLKGVDLAEQYAEGSAARRRDSLSNWSARVA